MTSYGNCHCGTPLGRRSTECAACGKTTRSRKVAERNVAARGGVRPYTDRDWMHEQYVVQEKSMRQIATESGAALRTIARWHRIHGIPSRQERTAAEKLRVVRRRERHHNYKGGRIVDVHGYVKVLVPDGLPFEVPTDKSRYIFEHRLVMASLLGRPLMASETVHHVDGNRQNNLPSNLQLRQGNHGSGVAMRCHSCGSSNVSAIPLKE